MKTNIKKDKKKYFTQETEDAIILYNKTTDPDVKSRIYEKHIHYAFWKLCQNLIHTFKFYHTEVDDIEHLQHEIIIYLLSKIHLYSHAQNIQDRLKKIIVKEFNGEYTDDFVAFVNNADKVTQQQINDFISKLNVSEECLEKLKKLTPPKAYSYFGTIAKRWLILYNKGNYSNKIKNNKIESLSQNDELIYTEYADIDLRKFIEYYIKCVESDLLTMFPKQVEQKIADAVLEIFRKKDSLAILHKKAIYSQIKEILYIGGTLDIPAPKITKVVNVMHSEFKKHYSIYLDSIDNVY
jgi:hypothetical protein